MDLKYYFSKIFEKNNSDSLLLHSSLLFKKQEIFKESLDIKEAIEDLSRKGFTFILPSYTFSFCKNNFIQQ